MRGKRSFYTISDRPNDDAKKGRSQRHAKRRNECLADRYYYFCNFTDKKYVAIIELLSEEFFLSKATIPDIIETELIYLQELKKRKPNLYYFQKRWPHIRW